MFPLTRNSPAPHSSRTPAYHGFIIVITLSPLPCETVSPAVFSADACGLSNRKLEACFVSAEGDESAERAGQRRTGNGNQW